MEHLKEKLELKLLAQITRIQRTAHTRTHRLNSVHGKSEKVNGFPVVTFLCNKMTSANQMCLRACVRAYVCVYGIVTCGAWKHGII